MTIKYQQLLKAESKLAESLIIKSTTLALNVSNSDEMKVAYRRMGMSFDKNDPSTWKFYLNLNGQYHFSNEMMYVTSVDTLEEIEFTKENLLIHRATRRAYLNEDDYVNSLKVRYPNQRSLIEGILRPVDLEEAINARENKILSYNKDLVEFNEVTLMENIQRKIDTYYNNWENKHYPKIESDFGLIQHYVMLALVPLFIREIREQKEKTYETHSFYIWNHLESVAGLGKYRPYLTKSQSLWLYRNIEYLKANLGKDSNVSLLIDNLLTPSGIPLGRYYTALDTSDIKYGEDVNPYLSRIALNFTDILGAEAVNKSIKFVNEKMVPLARDNYENLEDNIKNLTEKLKLNPLSEMSTKLYESELLSSNLRDIYSLEDVLIQHWGYLAYNDLYKAKFSFINPKTSSIMNMTAKEAFLVWIYVTNKVFDADIEEVPDITLYNLSPLGIVNKDYLLSKVNPDRISESQVQTLLETLAIPGEYISSIDFGEYCKEVYEGYKDGLKLYNTMELHHSRAQMRSIFNICYARRTCEYSKLGYTYFSDLFVEKKWELESLQKSDYERLMLDMMVKVLDLNIEEQNKSVNVQTALLEIFSKLTSLHTTVIQSSSANNIIVEGKQMLLLSDLTTYSESHNYVNVTRSSADMYRNRSSVVNLPELPKINTAVLSRVSKSNTNVKVEIKSKFRTDIKKPTYLGMSRIRYD